MTLSAALMATCGFRSRQNQIGKISSATGVITEYQPRDLLAVLPPIPMETCGSLNPISSVASSPSTGDITDYIIPTETNALLAVKLTSLSIRVILVYRYQQKYHREAIANDRYFYRVFDSST